MLILLAAAPFIVAVLFDEAAGMQNKNSKINLLILCSKNVNWEDRAMQHIQ